MTAAPFTPEQAAKLAAFDPAPPLPESSDLVRAILALHRPVSQNLFAASPLKDPVDVCAHCNTHTWPCRTVQVMSAVLAADPEPREEVVEPMSVDQLSRDHFGWWVDIPTRQVAGYLYAVHDDFNDGYPSRTLVLVAAEGSDAAEEEFTDSNPAGYPKTFQTSCVATPDRAPVGAGQLAMEMPS